MKTFKELEVEYLEKVNERSRIEAIVFLCRGKLAGHIRERDELNQELTLIYSKMVKLAGIKTI